MDLLVMIFKLCLSALLGALVGLERQTHGRPAGLRTHTLVCLGSTLFTLCSYEIAGPAADPGRIAAQIVTGVGFLGAGTIMRQGSIVIGLTSAASIWSIAAVGVAVGIGDRAAVLAAVSALLILLVLHYLPIFENASVYDKRERLLRIVFDASGYDVEHVRDLLEEIQLKVRVAGIDRSNPARPTLRFWTFLESAEQEQKLIGLLESCDNISGFSIE